MCNIKKKAQVIKKKKGTHVGKCMCFMEILLGGKFAQHQRTSNHIHSYTIYTIFIIKNPFLSPGKII